LVTEQPAIDAGAVALGEARSDNAHAGQRDRAHTGRFARDGQAQVLDETPRRLVCAVHTDAGAQRDAVKLVVRAGLRLVAYEILVQLVERHDIPEIRAVIAIENTVAVQVLGVPQAVAARAVRCRVAERVHGVGLRRTRLVPQAARI